MSDGLLVLVMLPWLKSVAIVAMLAPRPICCGLVPPFVAVGPAPTDSVCESCVVNSTFDDLKPFVSAFAMLLLMTAMAVSLSESPLTDVFSADVRPIGYPPLTNGLSNESGNACPLRRLQSARAAAATVPCPWLSTRQALNPKSLCY